MITQVNTTQLPSWLPPGGQNLFQAAKQQMQAAQAAGTKTVDLMIGQPQGPAILAARQGASAAVLSDSTAMHGYQDNGSPAVPGFAKQFVGFHRKQLLPDSVAYLPIPGIKSMLKLVLLACGAKAGHGKRLQVMTCTDPGYPTPKNWASRFNCVVLEPPLAYCGFKLTVPQLERFTPELVMANYPHNPSGQIMTARDWRDVCLYCQEHGVRLFNDAAYAGLVYDAEACTLAEVAVEFPSLSWAEAYSASKLIANGTGWRVGAMVGSRDFIDDIATIKGDADSGFVGFAAAGVLAGITHGRDEIESVRRTYHSRLQRLIKTLTGHGMQLACTPRAGFFTLWHAPKQAFDTRLDGDANRFNELMGAQAGIMGIPFDQYVRYAVCGSAVDVQIDQISGAFARANVSY
ncbi:MAG: aminotransferase class I/II-fold pyridoxal phosphate-dependent enzyme [Candidatus Paceibacterota bacterium]